MGQLMLVNPAKRRTRRGRSAAQKAATRKLVALNRSRRSGKKRSSAARRKNPIGLGRVIRRASRRSRRRNPAPALARGGLMKMGMTSVQGAGGALLVNTALNYVPFMPQALKSGNGKYIARSIAAVALGVFGSKVLPRNVAENMASGALTVALHDLMLGVASQAMPTLRLGDVGDYDDGVVVLPEGEQAMIGEYVSAYDSGDMGIGDVYDPTEMGEYVS